MEKQGSPELEFLTILAVQLLRRTEEREADYLRESIDFSVYFDERGTISKVEVFCEITALQDGINRVDAVAEYRADPHEGVLSITPVMGCGLIRLRIAGIGRASSTPSCPSRT